MGIQIDIFLIFYQEAHNSFDQEGLFFFLWINLS